MDDYYVTRRLNDSLTERRGYHFKELMSVCTEEPAGNKAQIKDGINFDLINSRLIVSCSQRKLFAV